MKETIEQILNESVTAPSPDNFQPWKFEVRGQQISVFKVPARMNHLLDCREHVLLLTMGMLIENIAISASHFGYSCKAENLPDNKPDLVAILTLNAEPSLKEDPLYPYIKERCTNRKMYGRKNIDPEIISGLNKELSDFPGMEIQLITRQDQIRALGKTVSAIDKIMFENKLIHDSLFKHITWSQKEEQETRQGLTPDAMEFNPGEKVLFKSLKNWGLVKMMNAIGFSAFVRFKNSKQYGSAAASLIVSSKNNTDADYIKAGRFVERLWLKATASKLSLHTIVGVIYCYQKVRENENDVFNASHAALLESSYKKMEAIARANGMTNNHIVFFSRLGFAKTPGHRSLRKKAEINFVS